MDLNLRRPLMASSTPPVLHFKNLPCARSKRATMQIVCDGLSTDMFIPGWPGSYMESERVETTIRPGLKDNNMKPQERSADAADEQII
jgi:hypothetical protein